MGRPILSILMCTIESRREQFKKLVDHINKQKTEDVQILYSLDNKEHSVGEKRQFLLTQAKGKYICFIDDDDWVPSYYVREILKAVKGNPDCVGFLIDCNINGIKSSAISSLKYKEWKTDQDGFKYVRSIYHKTPVKKRIALKVGFKDMRFGEDGIYSKGLLPYLKTESFINKVMYYYIYRTEPQNELRYG